jgi:hypothetical protein
MEMAGLGKHRAYYHNNLLNLSLYLLHSLYLFHNLKSDLDEDKE